MNLTTKLPLLSTIAVVMLLALFWVSNGFSRSPKQSTTYATISTQIPQQLTINVAVCAPDYKWLYGELGSIRIRIDKKLNGNCLFELENEAEGASLTYKCAVPSAIEAVNIFSESKRDEADYGFRPSFRYSFDLPRYCYL